ncbi:hypothetical protein EWB00_009118 [Schistosoma japonicum]|uniref:Uncharacterized protein n=1 Tax=Schistosoma japonicum TaxID=6182 RepID=A0A4Z2CNS8_SCHJA|nr:hypothetical protein EWB00_009118 [Schistosoma japonicum]
MGIKTERLYQKKNSAKCPFDVVLKCRRFENTVYRINVGGSNRYNRHPNGICSVEGCSSIVGNYDVVPFATAKESPIWSIQGRSYVSRKCIPSTYYSPSIQLGS